LKRKYIPIECIWNFVVIICKHIKLDETQLAYSRKNVYLYNKSTWIYTESIYHRNGLKFFGIRKLTHTKLR